MIDPTAAILSLRTRARSLVVATTGSATLAASTTGFTRSTGSFVTDGFAVGMEVQSSGFTKAANNGNGIITALTATVMTVSMFVITRDTSGQPTLTRPATALEAAAAARTVAAKLPSERAWENTNYIPVAGIPYVTEEWSPSGSRLTTAMARGGFLREWGDYFLTIYGVPGVDVLAIQRTSHALRLLFTPGTNLVAGSDVLHVGTNPDSDVGPSSKQAVPLRDHIAQQTKAPWWAETVNTIAA